MYLYKNEAKELHTEIIKGVTSEVADKIEFIGTLLEGDDWSLVIKAHSLIESVITELIIAKIKEKEMKDIIERLPLHGDQTSKLTIVKKYQLLSNNKITFIKSLSELRNKLAHKFEHVDFSFSEYLQTLDKNQKKSWVKAQIWFAKEDKINSWSKIAKDNPKHAVFTSVLMLVSLTVVSIHELNAKNKIADKAYQTTKQLLK